MESTNENVSNANETMESGAFDSKGKIKCPKCGNLFDEKEKACPHCGMKNGLMLCKVCGAQMPKAVKRCPKCGAKNKKPLYKRIWFWILVVFIVWINWPTNATQKETVQNNSDENVSEVVATATPIPTREPDALELVNGMDGVDGIYDVDIHSFHVTGVVKNTSNKVIRYAEIEFAMYDSAGNQLGSARDNITNLDAGGTWNFDALGISRTEVDTYRLVNLTWRE